MATEETIKLFTSVKPALMQSTLVRGTATAFLGVLLLLLAGSWMPAALLTYLGPFFLLIGGGLIAYGLIPYQRLMRLENQPNELVYVNNRTLQYIVKNRDIWTIPLESIEKIEYTEKDLIYGIAITLKNQPPKKIIVHDLTYPFSKMQKESLEKYRCDLFVPYFSRRAFTRIALLESSTD